MWRLRPPSQDPSPLLTSFSLPPLCPLHLPRLLRVQMKTVGHLMDDNIYTISAWHPLVGRRRRRLHGDDQFDRGRVVKDSPPGLTSRRGHGRQRAQA